MSLILIGTNHCDLRGPQRLLRYLQHYSPTHMIVEGHGELYPFAQPFLRPQARRALFFEHYPEFKENVKLNTLDAFLSSTGYEAAVSSLYADSHAVSLQYIDVPTDRLTSMIEDLALQEGYSTAHDHSTEALRELLALSPEEVFEFIDLDYAEGIPYSSREDREREALWVQALLQCTGTVMFVGGWFHIYSRRGLYEALSHLKPTRHKLNEADRLPMF